MNARVYIGEQFHAVVDLDTSATDAAYSLDGMTPQLRVRPRGSSASAVIVKTLEVEDVAAGTVNLTLDTSETAELDEGVYCWQIVDSASQLVLADGTFLTMPMIPDS